MGYVGEWTCSRPVCKARKELTRAITSLSDLCLLRHLGRVRQLQLSEMKHSAFVCLLQKPVSAQRVINLPEATKLPISF